MKGFLQPTTSQINQENLLLLQVPDILEKRTPHREQHLTSARKAVRCFLQAGLQPQMLISICLGEDN